MGLLPLEFTDCLTDSPYFRENLHAHEKELERTSHSIKVLIKEVKDLLSAAKQLSRAQRTLSHHLQNFEFECIGANQTDDEIVIAGSLKEFGRLIAGIEDERDRMLERAYDQFIGPLEGFRKDQIGDAKERKKKFDKQTAKFCQFLEKHVNLTTKKNENILQEADAIIEMEQRAFQQASLEYVFRLQEVQERKKFEFVETILGFMYGWLTFYHQGHEVAKDFKPFMTELQMRLQKTRENFNATRDETESLKKKMLDVRKTKPQDPGSLNKMYARQGYLFLMEKKAFGTTWVKQYCQYQKENRIFTMIPYTQTAGKITTTETLVLKSCVRRSSDSIDRRFCFDVTADDKPGVFTLQASSDEDRKLWLDAMDGKEPAYSIPGGKLPKAEETFLDDVGFAFVNKCITILESRGLEDQGLYRLVGVSSKVNKLIQMGLDRRKAEKLNLEDALEWENKTVTSSLKTYFRNLPEPLATFKLHNQFIVASKQESRARRISGVHVLVHRLPKLNFEMLDILIKHLCNVAAKAEKNLMTVSNLGVCFGPTLLRPEEETVAAIMDIKFCNVVVEILIENHDKIFRTVPDEAEIRKQELQQAVPKPAHSIPNTLSPQQRMPPPPSSAIQPVTHLHDASLTDIAQNGSSSTKMALATAIGPGLTVVTSYNTDIPMSVNTLGIPNPATAVPQVPVPPARQKGNHAKPLVIYNPAGPESNHMGSNSSSSTESISSRSSRDCNNHSSTNSSPQTIGKLNLHSGTCYRLPEQIVGNVKKRQSVDSILSSSRVRTLYHCVGENETELSFEPNQIITNVRMSREPGWLEGTLNGRAGLIPENYVEFLP